MATGTCLCGAVRISAPDAEDALHVCHCAMCRKWAGGPGLVTKCGDAVSFRGEASITAYASSDWAERGFCKVCGTHLFWRLKGARDYHVPAGLFDEGLEPRLTSQIFIDKKPGYYSFAEETEDLTQADVFARFAEETDDG